MMMNIINFSTTETEFPSFTICPDFDVAYKEDVLEKYKTSKWDMRGLRFPNTRSNNLSTLQFFKMVTYNLTEIVTSMSIETIKKYPASTNFTKLTMYDLERVGLQNDSITEKQIPLDEKKWISETYLLFGRCFSYVIPKLQKEHGVSIT